MDNVCTDVMPTSSSEDNKINKLHVFQVNNISIKLKYKNIFDMIENEKNKSIQTNMFLIPFYTHNNSLCSILSNKYNTYDFIKEAFDQQIVCGNDDDLENKKIAGIVNFNGIKICLFSYFSLWPHTKSYTSGNLFLLFKSIAKLLDDNINQLIIPPFGVNNKKSYKETAYILFTNIKKCCEDGLFPNISKIKFISLKKNNNDIITHLDHIIKIHIENDNICIICCENPTTHYFFGCRHTGFCLKCITNCTFLMTSVYMCPYCKQRSSIQEIPLHTVNLCDHDDKKSYVLDCNCSLFISCDNCIQNNTDKCCSFDINTSKSLFFP